MSRRLLMAALGVACVLHIAGTAATVEEQRTMAQRDPTRPPMHPAARSAAQPAGKVPALSSVLIGATRRLAVIDGRVMAEGEEHGGLKVWQIKADRVVVSVAGAKPMTLMLDNARIHKEVR